eukprot:1141402-Pelagomonas_calceolata.AAC.9
MGPGRPTWPERNRHRVIPAELRQQQQDDDNETSYRSQELQGSETSVAKQVREGQETGGGHLLGIQIITLNIYKDDF